MNPFLRPLPSTRPAVQPLRSAASIGAAGSVVPPANTRVQNLQAIAADVHARTARIEHVRALGHFVHEELKKTQHTGSSRLAWLGQQLKKMDT